MDVEPGVYGEGAQGDLNALTVTKDGIHLVGRAGPGAAVALETAGAATGRHPTHGNLLFLRASSLRSNSLRNFRDELAQSVPGRIRCVR